jgi:two-component system response regulator YesN
MNKILIVDDESLLRQGFIHMTDWSQHGFQIIGEAANGKEALEMMARQSPDIVVTDIKMPVMDGIELTRVIKSDYPRIQVLILSSYDDFEYVRETLRLGAFDYILKPKMNFADLLNVLQKASSVQHEVAAGDDNSQFIELREGFLVNLIEDGTLPPTAIRENLIRYHISLEETNLTMLAIVFDSANTVTKNEERKLFVNAIDATVEPSLNPVSFFYDSNLMITLMNRPVSAGDEFPDQICSGIIHTIQSEFSRHSHILASPHFEGYHLIAETFQKLLEKKPFCFYFPKDRHLYLSQLQKITNYIDLDLRVLNSLVEKFRFEDLLATVTQSVENQIRLEKYIEPYILKKFCSEICYLVIYKGVEMGFYWEEVNEKKFECLKRIENSADYESLMKVFAGILSDLELFFTENIQIKSNTVITAVIKYIHQNYDHDISLESTAKHFFIDKSYLCKLFKKHINQNFNDYLMQIRIKKAKELLYNPKYTVNAVSNQVGYSDYSYFGRIFKKIVGMTPSEYKKSLIDINK